MSRTSTRSARVLLASLTLFGCASAGGANDPGRPQTLFGLPGVVDSVRNTAPLDRTHWGVGAYDPAADRMLLRVNVDRHFIPASNMKLVVTAVALGRLGPDYRYTTTVHAGELRAGTATSLVVVGSGDPTLSARFHGEPLEALRALADSIQASGVRRIDGPLVIDATYFDAQRIHPTWEIGDLNWSYAAPVSAFAVEEGTITVVVRPGAAFGEPAGIDVIAPPGLVAIVNGVRTDTAYARHDVGFIRVPGTDDFIFSGYVPLTASPDTFQITVNDPSRFAGHALAALLQERGIALRDSVVILTGDAPDADAARWDTDAPGFQRITGVQSVRMAEIVEAVLEPSQNWIAEQLLKTLGAVYGGGGTWEDGIEVERRYLIDVADIDSAAFRLVDASGLSAQNLLTPDAIMRLLYHASETDWGPIYRAALAEPGEEGSTLENRLSAYSGRVFAKTGSITNVNSLSGYLVAADGREIIFSILSNASGVPAAQVRAGIDQIVTTMAALGTPAPPPVTERRLSP